MRSIKTVALAAAFSICGSGSHFAAADQNNDVLDKSGVVIKFTKDEFYKIKFYPNGDYSSEENYDQPLVAQLARQSLRICDVTHSVYYPPYGGLDDDQSLNNVTRHLIFDAVINSADREKVPLSNAAQEMIDAKFTVCAGYPIADGIEGLVEKTYGGWLIFVVPPAPGNDPFTASLAAQGLDAINQLFNAAVKLRLPPNASFVGYKSAVTEIVPGIAPATIDLCKNEIAGTCRQKREGTSTWADMVEIGPHGDKHRNIFEGGFKLPLSTDQAAWKGSEPQ